MNLDELRKLAEAATPGPYFVGNDAAEDAPDHTNSGLSMVDTGRTEDWPIARLCETPSANLIAALSPERILAMLDMIEAADGLPALCRSSAYDAARKRLSEL